jgi:hypothetical protein
MKKIALLSFVLLSQISFGQVTKSLGDFDKVTVFDKISVQLIASSENKIEISGNLASEVELVTKNNELKIRMPFDKLLKGGDITAIVYFKKIEGLEANEGSTIFCESEIKTLDFSLIAKEGGQITVNVDAQRVKVKSSNGARIKLEGKAQNLDIVINSGGVIEAQDCLTSQTVISVNAGGTADITATDLVDAKIRAGGFITIFGKPKQVNQKTILGGSIIMGDR